jgi:hypothetical protein
MKIREDRISTADIAGTGPATPTPINRQDSPGFDQPSPLFPDQEANQMRDRWDVIQTGFVDEPRRAVEDADALVASAIRRLAETFAEERSHLEGQWDRGDHVSTEDLRLTLQRYRSFFHRILSI